MTISLPPDVQKIIDTLLKKGHDAYIVGGCVRDSIRGVMPKDWDITTSAKPKEVKEVFPRTVETGIKHGTITVLIGGQGYEVTTYRIDGQYLDSRRPDTVSFTMDIIEDLSRRDFTMNAIAYNTSSGFIDPFDGRGDIERKLIRCVGDPMLRFGEDALRMLRAVRFAGQLGFAIDVATLDAISQKSVNLAKISAERIREELTRLLAGQHVEAVKILETTGLLAYVLVGHTYDGNLDKTIDWMASCSKEAMLCHMPRYAKGLNMNNNTDNNTERHPMEYLRLALFLAWSSESCEKILRALRFDNKTIRDVSQYVNMLPIPIPLSRYDIKKYLRQMPQANFENLLILQSIINPHETDELSHILQESRDIQAKGECYTISGLSVNGNDLIAAGIPPGKAIGEKLEELLDTVMREPKLNSSLTNIL